MSELQPNCESVPAGALIYPDDFVIHSGGNRLYASTFGHEWTRTTQTGYQREMTVDPYLPALETKVSKLLPSDSDCDTEQQQRMRWELRTAKRRYAETLGRILEQLKGGE